MTAFEPPDFDYFPGLQFNPEIYENTLTDTAGALPINPTFNSVTAPIIYTDEIQRDTSNTIRLFDGFPSVTSIIIGLQGMFFFFGNIVITGSSIIANGLPSIGLGDGSTDAFVSGLVTSIEGSTSIGIRSATTTITNYSYDVLASFTSALIKFTSVLFEVEASTSASIYSPLFRHRLSSSGSTQLSLSSTSSSLSNGTQASVFAPSTLINGSGSTVVSTTIGNGVAGGTLLLNAPSTELRGSSIRFDSTYVASTDVNLNFYSSSFNPTVLSSNIIASGGTALPLGGVLSFNVRTLDNNAILYNVNSTTVTLGGSGTSTTANGNFLGGGGSQGSTLIWSGDAFTLMTVPTSPATYAITPSSTPWGAVFCPPYANTTAFTITLANLNQRDGCYFYIYNGGNAVITVQHSTTGQAKLFGPGLTRGGVNTLTIGINAGRGFRNSIFPNGTLSVGFNNGYLTWTL